MSCLHLDQIALQPPRVAQSVYRDECTQCFDSIDDPDGLNVCLQCFNGGCAGTQHHDVLHHGRFGHPLVLNIRRARKTIVRDEPPAKISKLAITAETEEDRYQVTTTARCLACRIDLDKTEAKLEPIVLGVMSASTYSRKEEVKAWEQDLTSCEHILMLQQSEPRTILSGDLGHCSKCELKENLWLCLECGNLGCGRKQLGGVAGNSHGLAHANTSSHGVAVKLGSITPEGTADVYCYKCDDERIDEQLAVHLAHWGIMLSEREKTEKSLTEMQIEHNLRWDFSMTTHDGQQLRPLFGAGLTGLKNLGNSCYLASIVQCLFDLEPFIRRYHPDRVQPPDALPIVQDPGTDLETQLIKMADGLLSGRYSKPDPDVALAETEVSHQKGIAPSMLKAVVGRDHPEFSTMRQQDAFELLQHLFTLVKRCCHSAGTEDPTRPFRFTIEQRLQCLGCKKVRYTSTEQDGILIDIPKERLPLKEGPEAKSAAYREVTLEECLDRFTSDETVELSCTCGNQEGFTKKSLFKTYPDVLVVNANKMTVENWVPLKVDVPVNVPSEPFSLDKYFSRGLQAGEEELPENLAPVPQAPKFTPDPEAMAQLQSMGFSTTRCERALKATGNSDATAAMEWLFAHMEDPGIDDKDLQVEATAVDEDVEKVDALAAMGFSVPQARKALQETAGNTERAVDWLFNHPSELGLDECSVDPSSGKETETAGRTDLPATFQLKSIVCHKGTSIHAGHYVAFIRKVVPPDSKHAWVLFNDEKVVEAVDFSEMSKFAYLYFFTRV